MVIKDCPVKPDNDIDVYPDNDIGAILDYGISVIPGLDPGIVLYNY